MKNNEDDLNLRVKTLDMAASNVLTAFLKIYGLSLSQVMAQCSVKNQPCRRGYAAHRVVWQVRSAFAVQ